MNEKQRQAAPATDAYKGRMAGLVKSIVNNNMHAIRERLVNKLSEAMKAAVPAKAHKVFKEYQAYEKKRQALKKKLESMGCAINQTYPEYKDQLTLGNTTKKQKLAAHYGFNNFQFIHEYTRRVLGAQTIGEVEAIVAEIESVK